MTTTALREAVTSSLTPLALAREALMSDVEITPIIEGVTHCESCGFSYRTPRAVVGHRNLCGTLDLHRNGLDVQECAGCEDSENAPHAIDCRAGHS